MTGCAGTMRMTSIMGRMRIASTRATQPCLHELSEKCRRVRVRPSVHQRRSRLQCLPTRPPSRRNIMGRVAVLLRVHCLGALPFHLIFEANSISFTYSFVVADVLLQRIALHCTGAVPTAAVSLRSTNGNQWPTIGCNVSYKA